MLCTHNAGQPYASLAAFAGCDDMRFLYFVTPRSTRKLGNHRGGGRMALLIIITHPETDFLQAMAVTVLGSAGELTGLEKEAALKRHIRKHPCLDDFRPFAHLCVGEGKSPH